MMRLLLYSTSGCHLCEQAEELLHELESEASIYWETIDIVTDPQLVAAYGIRIPVVVRVADGAELGWPFELDVLRHFVHHSES